MKNTTANASMNSQYDSIPVTGYHTKKLIAERLLGVCLLALASPVIGLMVILVRCTSPGDGIYKQTRLGKDGQRFEMYKIRTMYHDAEACGNPQWTTPGDSRITRMGKILRFLHMDELPQLLNVARGEMSLIGPRPERPEFVVELARRVPHYMDRLAVLPGVTGLAQINLPPDESLESVRQKVVLDCEYIQSANLSLDLRIFFCTLFRMTGLRHGVAPKLFGVERDPNKLSMKLAEGPCFYNFAETLDDTAVNVPSLIAVAAVAGDSRFNSISANGHEAVYSVESLSDSFSSDHADQAETSSPRRPR